jgi:hypothetical protein
MKLEGLPEGYDAVRWGWPVEGEHFLNIDGRVLTTTTNHAPILDPPRLIVRKVEPIATWPQGVFCDGWIAQDADGTQWFYRKERPRINSTYTKWCASVGGYIICVVSDVLRSGSVTFRDDLPWAERCVQVGPSVEGADNG